MDKFCIFTNHPLDERNRSNEHIIPQCMGGRLQSRDLICRDCNSKFGSEFDESLIKRFCWIMYPLSLYNDQIKLKDWVGEHNGLKYLFTKNGIRAKDPRPIYDENGRMMGMVYQSEEAFRKHLKKLKKKDPTIDIQKTIDCSEKKVREIQGQFKFTAPPIGEKDFRCCGKICYEFLHFTKEDYIPFDNHFVNFILGNVQADSYPICPWYVDYEPFEKDIEKIYNIIVVEGRCEEKMVVAYFEGYGCLKTFMIIDRDYNGESFCNGYYQDLMENIADFFTPNISIPVSRDEAEILINTSDVNDYHEIIIKKSLHAANKARIYPFKVFLRELKETIRSMDNPRTIENMSHILEKLEDIFQKDGISAFVSPNLENVNEEYEEDALLEKINIHLAYLLLTFQKAGVKFDIIGEIVHII